MGAVVAAATRDRGDRDDDGLDAAATLLTAIDRLAAAVVTVLATADHQQVIVERHASTGLITARPPIS